MENEIKDTIPLHEEVLSVTKQTEITGKVKVKISNEIATIQNANGQVICYLSIFFQILNV